MDTPKCPRLNRPSATRFGFAFDSRELSTACGCCRRLPLDASPSKHAPLTKRSYAIHKLVKILWPNLLPLFQPVAEMRVLVIARAGECPEEDRLDVVACLVQANRRHRFALAENQ